MFVRGFRVTRLTSRILPWLRGAAGPARLPEHDPDPDAELVVGIPANTQVREPILRFRPLIDVSKHQDPLITLLGYIATVSVFISHCVFTMWRVI